MINCMYANGFVIKKIHEWKNWLTVWSDKWTHSSSGGRFFFFSFKYRNTKKFTSNQCNFNFNRKKLINFIRHIYDHTFHVNASATQKPTEQMFICNKYPRCDQDSHHQSIVALCILKMDKLRNFWINRIRTEFSPKLLAANRMCRNVRHQLISNLVSIDGTIDVDEWVSTLIRACARKKAHF